MQECKTFCLSGIPYVQYLMFPPYYYRDIRKRERERERERERAAELHLLCTPSALGLIRVPTAVGVCN
jgi:hypothetical protein